MVGRKQSRGLSVNKRSKRAKPTLTLLLSQEAVRGIVQRLAREIDRDYKGRPPLLVGVLKGAFVFMADLVRELQIPVNVEFVRLSSYGSSTQSSGKVRVVSGIRADLRGRDVLIVEDIVDTGRTTSYLQGYIKRRGPRSLKICALLDKPSRRVIPVSLDYVGVRIPDRFVVGYGLDMGEEYRELPGVYIIEE